MRVTSLIAAALLVTAGVGSAVAAGAAGSTARHGGADTSTYIGAAVRLDTTSNAIVDYTVNGETLLQRVSVQSRSAARSQGGISVDADLKSVTDLSGAPISVQTTTSTHATFTTESGARVQANDNDRGILVVRASGQSQYVTANLSAAANARQISDSRVVVTRDDGTRGTFIVVGEGNVTVNENGNVATELGQHATLVYRQYDTQRTKSEKHQEQLIAEGKAVAEVYVQRSNGSGQQNARIVTNVVNYSQSTTVEVTQTTATTVNMTVQRASDQGKVVIATVSKNAFNSTDDIRVLVDGDAAARAETYSAVAAVTDGGETSKFLVRPSTSATASVDVVIGINHFSQRNVAVTSTQNATATPTETMEDGTTSNETATDATGPGFGIAVALAALVALGAGLSLRRR